MSRVLHPVLSPARRQELVREGVALFHVARYFEAHEAWEEVWRSTTPEPRDLFQGLVQVAAAFHHLHARGRADVARRVLAKARRRLAVVREAPSLATHVAADAAVELEAFLAQLAVWDSWLAGTTGEPPAMPRLDWLLSQAPATTAQLDDSGRRAT